MAPLIINLGSKETSLISFTPRPIFPRSKKASNRLTGRWAGTREGLDDLEKRKRLTAASNRSSVLRASNP
jgi:hypothetical protein